MFPMLPDYRIHWKDAYWLRRIIDQEETTMSYGFLDIAMTPSVRAAQAVMGVEQVWQDFKGHRAFDRITEHEASFIGARDSFYIATVSEGGWPYVQHRGGPAGFLKVIDEHTLAFADYRGNRQYISVGNVAANDRACLFLMDYAHRARMKIYVRVEALAVDADPALTAQVTVPGYKAKIERVFRLRLEAFDWNCSQHITPRFTEEEVGAAVQPLRERLADVEADNAKLRAQLAEFARERT
jgi:predicted pyridoxine 5'-phosphate oxidase superfamily flavin-nucleotide-binding protein